MIEIKLTKSDIKFIISILRFASGGVDKDTETKLQDMIIKLEKQDK